MKASNDKKQTIILGSLGIVLLGVGAFQFVGSGNGATAPALKPAKEAAAEPDSAMQMAPDDNEFVHMPLAQRDPFKPQVLPSDGLNQVKPPAAPPRSTYPGPVSNSYVPPMPVPGPLPGGSFDNPGVITSNAAPNPGHAPSMKLSGVVIGGRQVALIETESGKQRTVRVGDTIAGRKVVAISRRGVVLEGQGQRSTLTLDDNAEN